MLLASNQIVRMALLLHHTVINPLSVSQHLKFLICRRSSKNIPDVKDTSLKLCQFLGIFYLCIVFCLDYERHGSSCVQRFFGTNEKRTNNAL